MPPLAEDHSTRPEQSNCVGPAAPQTYSSPRRLRAACNTVLSTPGGPRKLLVLPTVPLVSDFFSGAVSLFSAALTLVIGPLRAVCLVEMLLTSVAAAVVAAWLWCCAVAAFCC